MKGARHDDDGTAVDFDYEVLDRDKCQETPEEIAMALACEALSRVFCWTGGGQAARFESLSAQTVGLRSIAALWVLRPETFGGVSQSALAQRLGVTDSILSRYGAEFRDAYGFKGRGQRSDATRARMRAAHRAEASS